MNSPLINNAVAKLTELINDRAKRDYIGFTTILELSQFHVTLTALSTQESFFLPGICYNIFRKDLNVFIDELGKVDEPFVLVLKQSRNKMQLTIRKRNGWDRFRAYLGIKPLRRFKHKVMGHRRLYDNYPNVNAPE